MRSSLGRRGGGLRGILRQPAGGGAIRKGRPRGAREGRHVRGQRRPSGISPAQDAFERAAALDGGRAAGPAIRSGGPRPSPRRRGLGEGRAADGARAVAVAQPRQQARLVEDVRAPRQPRRRPCLALEIVEADGARRRLVGLLDALERGERARVGGCRTSRSHAHGGRGKQPRERAFGCGADAEVVADAGREARGEGERVAARAAAVVALSWARWSASHDGVSTEHGGGRRRRREAGGERVVGVVGALTRGGRG